MTEHGHGGSPRYGANGSPTYICWVGLRQRCYNSKESGYKRYGGRGVTVCARWDPRQGGSFLNFLDDLGEKPDWATGGIDRKDPYGNYEPGNCRWATIEEQRANRREAVTA